MEGHLAVKVWFPRVEVAPHGLVAVVAVDPKETDRQLPAWRHDLRGKVDQPHLLDDSGAKQVLEKGTTVSSAEHSTEHTLELLVRLDRVHGDVRALREGDRAHTPVAPDLDDTTFIDLPSQTREEGGLLIADHSLDLLAAANHLMRPADCVLRSRPPSLVHERVVRGRLSRPIVPGA